VALGGTEGEGKKKNLRKNWFCALRGGGWGPANLERTKQVFGGERGKGGSGEWDVKKAASCRPLDKKTPTFCSRRDIWTQKRRMAIPSSLEVGGP